MGVLGIETNTKKWVEPELKSSICFQFGKISKYCRHIWLFLTKLVKNIFENTNVSTKYKYLV